MKIAPDIELTADGSQTLRHPLLGETYHSLNGAVTESEHIFINNGFDTCICDLVRILEIGFGSGLNAYLTLLRAEKSGRKVAYTAVDLYPVDMETVGNMELAKENLFMRLHDAEWGRLISITESFSLHKIEVDLADISFESTFDLVYFDAFAPDCQPELWSETVFGKIFDVLRQGGILVTYSVKGDVKRALRASGFEVKRLPGPPGKRHILRAIKP